MTDNIPTRTVGRFLRAMNKSRDKTMELTFSEAAELSKDEPLFEVLKEGKYYIPYTDCDHYCDSIERPSDEYIDNVQQKMMSNLGHLVNEQFDSERQKGTFGMATRHGIQAEKKRYKLSWRCYFFGFVITMAEMKKVIVRKGLDKAGVGSLDSSPYNNNRLLGCVGFYKSGTDRRLLEPCTDTPLESFMVQNITGQETILKYDGADDEDSRVDDGDINDVDANSHFEGSRFAPPWEILVSLVMSLSIPKRCERGSYNEWAQVGWAIAGVARVAGRFEDGLDLWLQFCRQCKKAFEEDPLKPHVIYRRSRSHGRQRGWKSLMEWLKEDNIDVYNDVCERLGSASAEVITDEKTRKVVTKFIDGKYRCRPGPESITTMKVVQFVDKKYLLVESSDVNCPILVDKHNPVTTIYFVIGLGNTKEKCHHPDCRDKHGSIVDAVAYPEDVREVLGVLLKVDDGPETVLSEFMLSVEDNKKITQMKLCPGEKITCPITMGEEYELPDNRYCPIHNCFHDNPENCLKVSTTFQRLGVICRRDPTKIFPDGGIQMPQKVVNIFIQNATITIASPTPGSDTILPADYSGDSLPFYLHDRGLHLAFVKSIPGKQNDIAVFVHALWGEEFRFFYDKWHKFQSHIWEPLERVPVLRSRLSTVLCDIYRSVQLFYRSNDQLERAKEKIETIEKTISSLKTATFKDSVMKEIREVFEIQNEGFAKLVNQADLLPFTNGVLDLNSYEFRPGRPEDRMSKSTGIEFKKFDQSDEICRELDDFFTKILPNKNVRDFVLKVSALCMTRETKYQLFCILTGTGANGKSLYLDLMNTMLGQFAATASTDLLTGKRESSHSSNESLMALEGARLATFNEPANMGVIQADTMKILSGGRDKVSARENYGKQVTFVPTFKLILACNTIPRMSEDSEAVWRRVQVIHFPMKFCDDPDLDNEFEAEIDLDLGDKIPTWAPYLASLLIEALKNLRKDGLQKPSEVEHSTLKYRQESDPYADFWTERMVYHGDPNRTVNKNLVKDKFKDWLKGQRHPSMKQNQINTYLDSKMKHVDTTRMINGTKTKLYGYVKWDIKRPVDSNGQFLDDDD